MYSHHEGSVARKLDQHHITSLCKPPVDWELGWIIVSTLKPFFFGRTDFFEAWINLCCVQQFFKFICFSTSDSNQFSDSTMDSSFRPRFSTFHLTWILHLNTHLWNQFLFNLTFTVYIILLFYLAPILHLSAPWIQIVPVGNGQMVMKSGTSFAKIERISKQWGKL